MSEHLGRRPLGLCSSPVVPRQQAASRSSSPAHEEPRDPRPPTGERCWEAPRPWGGPATPLCDHLLPLPRAVTDGIPATSEGKIQAALKLEYVDGVGSVVPVKSPSRKDILEGVKRTLSHFRVVATGPGCALVQLQPVTGFPLVKVEMARVPAAPGLHRTSSAPQQERTCFILSSFNNEFRVASLHG